MLKLRNLSLRGKQTLIIMLTSSVVLLLACAAFVAFDVVTFRRDLVETTSSLAEVVGNNTTAAIDFNDPTAAAQTLAALRGELSIVLAHVHTLDGRTFAAYSREGVRLPPEVPHSLEAREVFTAQHLHLFRPITQRGEQVGSIELVVTLDELRERLWRYAGIAGLVLAASLLAAFGLSNQLQKVVSDPILQLAKVARIVAVEKNYSVRATRQSNDELGQLVDGFNEMLVQIEQRDAALQAAHHELEKRVAERTAELAQTNQALSVENNERKRTEESLRLLGSAVEQAKEAILITDAKLDLPGPKIIFINPAFTQMTGYTAAEAIGKTPRILQGQRTDRAVLDRLRLNLESGEVFAGEAVNYRKDGTEFDLEWQIAPLRNASGAITHFVAIERDITERKKAEAQLKASFKEIGDLKAAQDEHAIVAITNPQGKITYVNDKFCAISKFSREELMGKDHRIVNSSFHSKEFIRNLWATITHGNVWKGEIQNKAKDGSIYWVDTTIVPFLDENGKPLQYVAIRADITERKHAEAELEIIHQQLLDASRRGGMAEIATNVLHNVGNVLNSVNVSAGVIVESMKKSRIASLSKVVNLIREHESDLGAFLTHDARGKQVPAYLAQLADHLAADQVAIISELDSLRGNIEHIKEIVAMQQSYAKVGGVKEMVNVVTLVEDSLRMNEGAMSRHGVTLIREFETVPPMNLEKHKILQILVNLLRNAKYACDESGRADKRLTMRVANGEGQVTISVTDNGVGIPAGNLTRIFNHGFTTRKDGHGFGLHSGALAAKEMGGSLTVRSDGPGQGATFTLELPYPTKDTHE
jgi:PAS domain S-box-containing protein